MGTLWQSSANGNLEVVVPRRDGGGAWHWYRDQEDPALSWHGPSAPFGCPGNLGGLSLIESSFTNLEIVASQGDHLCHTARVFKDGEWVWQTPQTLPGSVASGTTPGFAQSRYEDPGSFEVVAPLPGSGLGHWRRDNTDPTFPWFVVDTFGENDGTFGSVTLIHSSASGNLEVLAESQTNIQRWWRDATGWHRGADAAGGIAGPPVLCEATFGGAVNYQLVCPTSAPGIAHWWADPADAGGGWHGPTVIMTDRVRSAGMVQSAGGNLELVLELGDRVEHWWRDAGHPFEWHGPNPIWHLDDYVEGRHGTCEVMYDTGTVAIHAALLRTGKVLVWSFHDHHDDISQSHLINPETAETSELPNAPHAFCSGLAATPDGTVVVTGGHHGGIGQVHVFEPEVGKWEHAADMSGGRWYPTQTCLPDGRVTTMSGTLTGGGMSPTNPANNSIEFFDRDSGLSPPTDLPSPWSAAFPPETPTIDLYPYVYVLPEGDLFVHSRHVTRRYDWKANSWGPEIHAVSSISRTYPGQGSSVLLALDPPDYRARVLIVGGGGANPDALDHHTSAVATAELIDLSVPNPSWRSTASMANARVMPDAVLLPDGSVVVCGGSASGRSDAGGEPVFPIERFDPVSETWSTMASIAVPRLYHSTALLLADARVLMMGKDGIYQPDGFQYPEHRGEVFTPPYLYAGPRPVVASSPQQVGYGQEFSISSAHAHSIDTVRVARLGAVTHSFNHEQRLVGLVTKEAAAGSLTVEAPPNANLAPPGWYLLYALAGGVPSAGRMIRIT